MPQLTVNKKNRRETVKKAPLSRNKGFLNHRIRLNRIKHNNKYSPTSDTEKGKIPKIRANSPFKTG